MADPTAIPALGDEKPSRRPSHGQARIPTPTYRAGFAIPPNRRFAWKAAV
jgi:hypothetical protein